MSDKTLTTSTGIPVSDDRNSITAGPRGPVLMQDFPLTGKRAHFNHERIPHTQKRDPVTNLKSPEMVWDFWSLSPAAMHQITILMLDRGVPATFCPEMQPYLGLSCSARTLPVRFQRNSFRHCGSAQVHQYRPVGSPRGARSLLNQTD